MFFVATNRHLTNFYDPMECELFVYVYLESLSHRFDKLWWDELQPHNAIEEVLRVIRQANAFITRHTPWNEKDALRRQCILSVVAEALRICGFLLQPIIPNLSLRLLNRLGVYADDKINQRNLSTILIIINNNNGEFVSNSIGDSVWKFQRVIDY
ncbi:unnamed protein product [Trichobilharzia regenti]|nr:unnamed protein product [Trichobilharzia regenti]